MYKFDELIIRCDIQEDSFALLIFDVHLVMLSHTVDSIEVAQSDVSFETYLEVPLDRKSTFKVGIHPKQQSKNNIKPNISVAKNVKDKTWLLGHHN